MSESTPSDTRAQQLEQHKGRKFDQPPYALERRPIVYGPSIDSGINPERLPNPDQMRMMDLAYREQPFPNSKTAGLIESRLGMTMLTTTCWSMILVTVLPIIPWSALLYLSGTLSLLLVVWLFKNARFSFTRLLLCVLVPPLATFAFRGMSYVTSYRFTTVVVLAFVTVYIFNRWGKEPFEFHREWLLTHPRLKPETRLRRHELDPRPDLFVLSGLLFVACFIPLMSNWLAQIAMVVVAAIAILGTTRKFHINSILQSVFHRLRNLIFVAANFSYYGLSTSGAPGIWQPKRPRKQRKHIIWALCAMPTVTLAIALNGFFPWDFPGIESQLKKSCSQIVPESLLFPVLTYTIPKSKLEQWPTIDVNPVVSIEAIEKLNNLRLSREEYQQAYKTELELAESKQANNYPDQVWTLLRPEIRNRPFLAWLLTGIAVVNGAAWLAWLVALAFLLSVVLPTLVLIASYSYALQNAEILENRLKNLDQDERPEWQWYVDRIRSSKHKAPDVLGGPTIKEREHLFLGIQPGADFPVLLHRNLLAEHAYFVGDSGSGKTSLGLMPLLLQLIRKETAGPGGEVEETASDPPPIVILDLKGDMALFNTVKHEAQTRRPNSFFYLTPEPGRESCFFNPFQSLDSDNRSMMQLAQILLDSLGLNHGEGYGKSYFARRSRHTMFIALNREPKPKSISELADRIFELRKDEDAKDTFELFATIYAMTQYPQLNSQSKNEPAKVIHMPTLLEQRQVAYFWLPSALESVSVREIGKLALYSLLTAAIDRQRAGLPVRQSYLVIDEFQRIVGENFKVILEQARSFGISVILANQTRSDLKVHDVDLRTTVNTNTRFKQFFSVTDPLEMKDLSELSGDELGILTSRSIMYGGTGPSSSDSFADTLKPRLMRNDILKISDHPLDSIIHVSRGSGYSQFGGACLHVRSTWPITKETYDQRANEPWPQTEIQTPDTPATTAVERKPKQIDDEAKEKLEEIMRRLYKKYEE